MIEVHSSEGGQMWKDRERERERFTFSVLRSDRIDCERWSAKRYAREEVKGAEKE